MSKMDFRLVCCRTGEFEFRLQPIPGDGNCLFGSLVHQINGIHPTDPVFSIEVSQMRASIVEHLSQNFSRYWVFLVPFAEDFIKCGFTDVYDRVRQYLKLLSQDGTWGGEECLSVACELYDINITIWEERSCRFREYSAGSATARKVEIYYTGSHYDSVMSYSHIDSRASAESADVPKSDRVLDVPSLCGQAASGEEEVGAPNSAILKNARSISGSDSGISA